MFWRGVVGYLPVNIVQGLVGLLTIAVFTRVLTPADYGVYALSFAAVSLAQTAVFLWMEAAMARFYVREAEAGRAPGHFATIYRSFAVITAAFLAAAALTLWLWPMSGPLKTAIASGLFTIPLRSLVKLSQERRRAAGDVAGAAALDMIQTAVGFAAGAGLALIGLGGAAPVSGSGAIAAVLLVWVLPGDLKRAKGEGFEAERARAYFAYGMPVAASLIMSLALATTDRFLLAAFLNETTVGVYQAGYSLANRTLDVMFIWLGMAGQPAAVAAFERGGKPALDAIARDQAGFMIALTLPAAVGLALVAKPLAAVMIGEGLRAGAAQVTPWIAASALFAGINTYYFHTAFTLARHTKRLLLVIAIPAVVNLGLNLVLIPRFGLQGAVWATLASYMLGLGVSIVAGRPVLALPIPWSSLARAGAACAAMALVIARMPAPGGMLELAEKACAGVLAYAAVAFALDLCGVRTHAGRLRQVFRMRAA